MKPNTKIIIIVLIIITIAISVIKTNHNNLFYKTNETLSTTVVNKYYGTGKMGGSYTMILKSKDGRIFHFPAKNYKNRKKGDNVTLHLYKRKNGDIKYQLY